MGKQLDKGNESLYGFVCLSDIDIYYYKHLDTKDGVVTVDLSEFLFFKSLDVKGVNMY
ncbi:MAG: hypothetical protein ACK5NF_06585 [Bacilli bacterium]